MLTSWHYIEVEFFNSALHMYSLCFLNDTCSTYVASAWKRLKITTSRHWLHSRIPSFRCVGKPNTFPSYEDIKGWPSSSSSLPLSSLIPSWKCHLRNVVILCWDVMMVGDRQRAVSLVFTRTPLQKSSQRLKPDECELCCGVTTSAVLCCCYHWLGRGGTIINPACIFSAVWVNPSLCVSAFLLISLMLPLLCVTHFYLSFILRKVCGSVVRIRKNRKQIHFALDLFLL